jgi:hypothetical protein
MARDAGSMSIEPSIGLFYMCFSGSNGGQLTAKEQRE